MIWAAPLAAVAIQPWMAALLVVAAFGVAVVTFYAMLSLGRHSPLSGRAPVAEPAGEAAAVSPEGTPGLQTGIPHIKLLWWAYLASDCMLFGSLIAGYLIYKGRSIVGPYPMDVFDFQTTTISTFVLLMSSVTMVLQLAAIQKGDLARFRLFNILTILAGLTFLGFQVYEFKHFYHEGLTLQTNLFGSSFYLLTGMHGTHVAVGVLWMLSLLIYSYWGGVTKERALDVEVAGLYWHFVDVVWIVIFSVVYLMEYTA